MQSVQSCERESSSSWQELLLVWQMQSYDYDKYNRTIPTNTILLIQSWAAKKVRGNHHHPHCCSRSCSLYERLVDPQTTGGWPLTITPNTISLRQMQSYNYDKYNRTIGTYTILLLQSWAEGQVKQNMGVNKGRWEHSLVRRYFVKRSSKFTRTGIFLFAPCPLSLTQVVVWDVLTSYEAICLNTNRRQLSPPPNVYCP